jgi:excisionase family DNA binding protein
MATIRPGLTGRKIGADLEPLAVSPRQACVLLGIGNTRLYELIGDGELVSYLEGRARRITMQSIRARVARLAATVASGDAPAP